MESSEQNELGSLQEVIEYFDSPDACVEFLASVRWPNGVECPACGSKRNSYLSTRRMWKCMECYRQFSAKLGTIFEDSPIPLKKWMIAVWLVCNCKNGVSSYEIARDVKVTQKSAWFMLHRIREAMADRRFGFVKFGTPGGNGVEVDETFVGGRAQNMHKDRKLRIAQKMNETTEPTYKGKTVVMGMLDRDLRNVRAHVIPNIQRETLQNAILKHVRFGSRVFTDEFVGYNGLNYRFVHEYVNHMVEYVRGKVHTNGIENFWSLLKRSLRGTYVAVEPFHLQRYVDEQAFRFNNRGGKRKEERVTDFQRFRKLLTQIVGKRLTYAELTGKVGETAF
jgi:transposase-like protein